MACFFEIPAANLVLNPKLKQSELRGARITFSLQESVAPWKHPASVAVSTLSTDSTTARNLQCSSLLLLIALKIQFTACRPARKMTMLTSSKRTGLTFADWQGSATALEALTIPTATTKSEWQWLESSSTTRGITACLCFFPSRMM